MTSRPHIPDGAAKRVENFKRKHYDRDEDKHTPKYRIYEVLVKHFIDSDGKWKSTAPKELKEKLGEELAI